jgi:hypothetical protein
MLFIAQRPSPKQADGRVRPGGHLIVTENICFW